MSDERTGRELAPREPESQVQPVAAGDRLEVDRFSAGPRAHTEGLTEERAAQVVRQSGNARNVAFLAVLLLALVIPVYWFYDLGIPAMGAQGRMEQEKEVQLVTDVSRGYAQFQAACASCHGVNGDGKPPFAAGGRGGGPPLDDQGKLYDALTADGKPGKGHLNPQYLDKVLSVGGRYVCGDPKSVMPAWKQPNGPLNYRTVEELIAWLTASSDIEFEYDPAAHGEAGAAATPVHVRGWRDPNYTPPPGATPVPACWRPYTNPAFASTGGGGGGETAGAIENPGTADSPRVIRLQLTSQLQIADEAGTPVASIPVKAGEVVTFEVANTAGIPHNFYIGTADVLSVNGAVTDVGIPDFTEGTKSVTWTVPAEGALQYACTVPGHYTTMHGDFAIQP